MLTIPPNAFSEALLVTANYLDRQLHVNNVVYVQWMQEIARKHWESIPEKEHEKNIAWVVRRHEIDYLHEAVLNDLLVISTWTGEHTAVSWTRHCAIIRKSDGKTITRAKSVWVLVDKKTGKPQRIDESILNRFQ
ncbi:MAG: hypothetical protein RLZZ28_948 [Bacteroidota bacterium]|jgi:acyl-CoA thioester hydrolase